MKQNILVVDDHRENLIALEAILDGEGRNLVMAQSGNDALALALKQEFALVLLDVQMPEMDGFEVAELLRQNRKTRHLPIIFVTALSKEEQYIFKGYECGAVDYLFKPIDATILEAKVRVFLELDRQRRKLKQAVVQMKRLKDENERLLQALGEAVVGCDVQGRITFCNDAACLFMDESREQLVGQAMARLIFNDDNGKPRWDWQDSPMLAHCEQGESWSNQEHSLHHPGKDGWQGVVVHANPINDDAGRFTGVVMVLQRPGEGTRLQSGGRTHRRYPRKKLFQERIVFDRTTGGNVGRLVNLSLDGFKLILRREVHRGERFQLGMVLPGQIAGANTASFDGKAVWCESLDTPGEFQVGFQFVELSPTGQDVIAQLMEND